MRIVPQNGSLCECKQEVSIAQPNCRIVSSSVRVWVQLTHHSDMPDNHSFQSEQGTCYILLLGFFSWRIPISYSMLKSLCFIILWIFLVLNAFFILTQNLFWWRVRNWVLIIRGIVLVSCDIITPSNWINMYRAKTISIHFLINL